MAQQETISFLEYSSVSTLHRQIKNICTSYSNPWDVLAELTQNSVDAIKQHIKLYGTSRKHKIQVDINALDKSISIYDTGIGFSSEKFSELIAPHGTDKLGAPDTIGEKGVGLTYVIFTSEKYHLETQAIDGYIHGEINGALSWRKSPSTSLPEFTFISKNTEKADPISTFTKIQVSGVEPVLTGNDDIFLYSPQVLEFIIRTKTAIGWVDEELDDSPLEIEVTFNHTDQEGKKTKVGIEPKFMLPHHFLSSKSMMNLEDFKTKAATLDDTQKAKKLRGKAIYKIGSVERAGRSIKYYAFFAPSRNLWKEISEKGEFILTDEAGNQTNLYIPGIYIASRGMPTGINIEPPSTGGSGYWPNFFIILEDNSIEFDLGRKSIPGRTKGLLREIAKSLFSEFRPFFQYATSDPPVSGSGSAAVQQYEKSKVFEELKKLPDLGIDKISYLKHPDGQEAAVVALFHEFVSSGLLRGYMSLHTGFKETYDLWCVYRLKEDQVGNNHKDFVKGKEFVDLDTVIEYKYMAEDILPDVDENRKQFIDIDLIVCWDFNEKKFSESGVSVDPLTPDDVFYHGSNFMLSWPGAFNLGAASEKPLLSLRRFVEVIKTQQ